MDDLEYRIGKFNLAEGDVLVVKCLEQPGVMAWDHISRCVRLALGPDVRFMILEPRIDLAVLTRAEIEARAAEPSAA